MTKNFNYNAEIINDKNSLSYLKIVSIFELMNIGDLKSLNILYNTVQNEPCELVRHEAVFALGEMGSYKKSINLLKKTFENDRPIIVKHKCLITLGTIGSEDDIPFLESIQDTTNFEITCSTKIAIDRINQKEDFENLVKNDINEYSKRFFDYENSTQNERIQILFQLMRIADENSLNLILRCLKEDPCRVVRHEVGFVLGEIGTEKAVKCLIKGLESEKTEIVIHESLFALGTAKKKSALGFIEKFINHESYVISESAKIARDRILYLENPYSGARHFANLKRVCRTYIYQEIEFQVDYNLFIL